MPSWRPWSNFRRTIALSLSGFGHRGERRRFLRKKSQEHWCGRWESNPHEEKSPEDFHADCGFRRLDAALCNACDRFAVWTIPSPSPAKLRGLGAARLVSTPSRNFFRAWLGIATKDFEVSPTLSSSASPVSRRALNLFKSSASAIPPRPHGVAFRAKFITGQETLIYMSASGLGCRRFMLINNRGELYCR